jgi:hypothetical protein
LVLQTQHGVEKETRGAFGFWCYKHNMVLKKRQEELLDFGATNTTWCWKRDKSSYGFFFPQKKCDGIKMYMYFNKMCTNGHVEL